MPFVRLDPAPRRYPDWVWLLRRAQRPELSLQASGSAADIEAWLLGAALEQEDLLALFQELAWRLVAAGLPLDRASLHVGTLHPQLLGFAWNWARDDGLCDEVKVEDAARQSEAFRRNPLSAVIDRGERVRARADRPDDVARYPLLADLAQQGYSEYVALPLRAGGAQHNAATVATKAPGGFTAAQFTWIERVLRLLALHVERHIALRVASNVLDTYLGPAAGQQVLRGSIKRGDGQAIQAILWVSDLRGFTDLADRLSGPQMLALLDAYFECLVGAILAQGGEVLKFIGDGLLAVFPYAAYGDERAAARAALAAAESALAQTGRLNAAPPPALAGIPGWSPLRSGIALHAGEVFFGNLGAPERLDFTVIGPAVNAAARVEALSKALGRQLLVTGPVARLLDRPLEPLGEQSLRGLARPLPLFGLPGEG